MNGTAEFSFKNSEGFEDPQTGEFDGMIGQLTRKEADIGGTVLHMLPERVSQMDFISMIVDTRSEIIFRAPPLSYVSNIYYYPFVGIVWLASAVLTILGSVEIYFAYILRNEKARDQILDGLSDIILLASGLVCQVGIHLSPRSLSGRISSVNS